MAEQRNIGQEARIIIVGSAFLAGPNEVLPTLGFNRRTGKDDDLADGFDYDVFLSFSSDDEEIARPMWKELSHSGLRVFWSEAALKQKLGESWPDTIQSSLERSRHL